MLRDGYKLIPHKSVAEKWVVKYNKNYSED